MKLVLVRHAKAESAPRGSAGPRKEADLLRTLSPAGNQQAQAIGELLAQELENDTISRIVCGPALRCQQTLEPFAMQADPAVEIDDRLGKGGPLQRVLES